MKEKQEQIKQIIIDYENKIISGEKAVSLINSLIDKAVEKHELDNDWSYTDIDSFSKKLAMPEIKEWQQIDDEEALRLIREIFENLGDDSILDRNMNALEKRYSKPTGRLITWIFHEDINEPEEILKLLKQNTSIAL